MEELLEALSKISNHCADLHYNCEICPLKNPRRVNITEEHLCELRNLVPVNWYHIIDRLREGIR